MLMPILSFFSSQISEIVKLVTRNCCRPINIEITGYNFVYFAKFILPDDRVKDSANIATLDSLKVA